MNTNTIVIAVGIGIILLVGLFAVLRWRHSVADAQNNLEIPKELQESTARNISERKSLRARDQAFFDTVSALLYKHDPIGLNGAPRDEYEPEAGTIIPRLPECQDAASVHTVVYEEFIRWFGADTAGPKSNYIGLSTDLWNLWQKKARR